MVGRGVAVGEADAAVGDGVAVCVEEDVGVATGVSVADGVDVAAEVIVTAGVGEVEATGGAQLATKHAQSVEIDRLMIARTAT